MSAEPKPALDDLIDAWWLEQDDPTIVHDGVEYLASTHLAEAIIAAGWMSPEEAAAREAAARREALLEAADEMDNTDDPDAIYVDNGDIDLWLRARAERIQGIEADAYIADERDKEGGND